MDLCTCDVLKYFKKYLNPCLISSNITIFIDCDCESVEHVLWECPAYSSNRSVFINSLSKILCSDFHLMSAFEKT